LAKTDKQKLQASLDVLLAMKKNGEDCPLNSNQISIIIDLIRQQEERISELEQTIRTWKIAVYAGSASIVAVFYVFDWFFSNAADIREMLQQFIDNGDSE